MREKVWTDEARAEQSAKMKARWAAGKMGHKKDTPAPIMPKQNGKQHVDIRVDWDTLPISQAQALFGQLRDTMNHAGKILNNRLMETPRHPCGGSSGYGCGKLITDLEAKSSDSGYTNKNGIIEKILLCCEPCHNKYFAGRMEEKHKSRMRA